MSKTARIFLIVLCLSATLSAQVLGTMEITHVPDAERGPWINQDPDHAILVVYSDIEKMTFQTNHGGIVDLDNPNRGVYRIWLMPGTHQITYSAEGFRSEKDRIYIQAKDVGEVRVKVTQVIPTELPVVIQIDPEGSVVRIDGEQVDVSVSPKLSIGEHSIEIVKSGYVTIKDKFSVSEDNILFEYKLRKEILQDMLFVNIPGGTFSMGSKKGDRDEKPVHLVKIKAFHIMTTEVTQGMWEEVMGSSVWDQRNKTNPDFSLRGEGFNNPMYYVSWKDVQSFIRNLNQRDPGKNYRLPSEAEWEYACRAGKSTKFCNGDSKSDLKVVGWFDDNSSNKTRQVGQKQPNGWGLYDMHGNVWEWCEDRWHENYDNAPNDGSAWVTGSDTRRILRGGAWDRPWKICQSTLRNGVDSDLRSSNWGFRLVRSL